MDRGSNRPSRNFTSETNWNKLGKFAIDAVS